MSAEAAAGALTIGAAHPQRFAWLRMPLSIGIAMLLALTPFSAILVVGWLVRLMQREAAITLIRERLGASRPRAIALLAARPDFAALAPWTGWLAASGRRESWLGRNFGGLIETLRAGLSAALVLALATLPFTSLLLVSWWAGWENSFNKGYEQAWVGPAVAALGIAVALLVLPLLPMGLAHFAAERRLAAMFELGTLRALLRAQRWWHLWLSFAVVIASLPIAIARILPVFIENWWPGFSEMPPDVIDRVAREWHIVTTVYLVIALVLLRRAQARCYARAALALPPERVPFCYGILRRLGTEAAAPTVAAKRSWRGAILPTVLTLVIWSAFIAQIYVSQFANHAWWNWLNHPMIGLPWIFRPY